MASLSRAALAAGTTTAHSFLSRMRCSGSLQDGQAPRCAGAQASRDGADLFCIGATLAQAPVRVQLPDYPSRPDSTRLARSMSLMRVCHPSPVALVSAVCQMSMDRKWERSGLG